MHYIKKKVFLKFIFLSLGSTQIRIISNTNPKISPLHLLTHIENVSQKMYYHSNGSRFKINHDTHKQTNIQTTVNFFCQHYLKCEKSAVKLKKNRFLSSLFITSLNFSLLVEYKRCQRAQNLKTLSEILEGFFS